MITAWPRHGLLVWAHSGRRLVRTIVASMLPALTLNAIDGEESTVETLCHVLCRVLATVKTTWAVSRVTTGFFLTDLRRRRGSRRRRLAGAGYSHKGAGGR